MGMKPLAAGVATFTMPSVVPSYLARSRSRRWQRRSGPGKHRPFQRRRGWQSHDHAGLFGGVDVHLGAHGTHGLDVIHQLFKVGALLGQIFISALPGHSWVMMVSALPGRAWYISSVMKGMKGCSSFRALSSTYTSTLRAVSAAGVLAVQAGLQISMYQSQYTSQIKFSTLSAARPKLVLVQVGGGLGHLGQLGQHPLVAHVQQRFLRAGRGSSGRFISTKRAAFHSLLAKLRLAVTFSSL